MPHTVKKQYRGWDIALRCYHRPGSIDELHPPTYAAMAEAELLPGEDPTNWIDPRVQILDTGSRSFKNGKHCIEELFSEVKQLIDALKR